MWKDDQFINFYYCRYILYWCSYSIVWSIIYILLWILKSTPQQAMAFAGHSSDTVNRWQTYRWLYVTWDLRIGVVHNRIGGMAIIVEVDESKFGHRKYNRGFPVEGWWVKGDVERTNEARMFAVCVDNRNADTIQNVLTSVIIPGTMVYVDCWQGYTEGEMLANGFYRDTVKHTYYYVQPESWSAHQYHWSYLGCNEESYSQSWLHNSQHSR